MTTIRPATPDDAAELGRMAGGLVRLHHTLDPLRFMIREPIEEGYGRWLAREATNTRAIVLVAVRDDKIVGYVYGTLEDRDWMLLRDACGGLQDIWVDEHARRGGVARMLADAIIARFRELGVPRVVLMTAAKNEGAQQFFDAMGFRRTMIEMAREM
jgi:ribosomal protein S18 acetylase RimI-like enzyme